jgi:hypothetical protein
VITVVKIIIGIDVTYRCLYLTKPNTSLQTTNLGSTCLGLAAYVKATMGPASFKLTSSEINQT